MTRESRHAIDWLPSSRVDCWTNSGRRLVRRETLDHGYNGCLRCLLASMTESFTPLTRFPSCFPSLRLFPEESSAQVVVPFPPPSSAQKTACVLCLRPHAVPVTGTKGNVNESDCLWKPCVDEK